MTYNRRITIGFAILLALSLGGCESSSTARPDGRTRDAAANFDAGLDDAARGDANADDAAQQGDATVADGRQVDGPVASDGPPTDAGPARDGALPRDGSIPFDFTLPVDSANGNHDCQWLFACLQNCNPGDQSCANGCINQSAPAAVTAYARLSTCMQNAAGGACQAYCNGTATKCEACLLKTCEQQLVTCIPAIGGDGGLLNFDLGPPPNSDLGLPPLDSGPPKADGGSPGDAAMPVDSGTGPLGCASVIHCMIQCDPNDQMCPQLCFNRATPKAVQLLDAIALCQSKAVQGSCASQCAQPGGVCEACIQSACVAEITDCINDV